MSRLRAFRRDLAAPHSPHPRSEGSQHRKPPLLSCVLPRLQGALLVRHVACTGLATRCRHTYTRSTAAASSLERFPRAPDGHQAALTPSPGPQPTLQCRVPAKGYSTPGGSPAPARRGVRFLRLHPGSQGSWHTAGVCTGPISQDFVQRSEPPTPSQQAHIIPLSLLSQPPRSHPYW